MERSAFMTPRRLGLLFLASALAACASKNPPAATTATARTPSSLEAARAAVKDAEAAGADKRAAETYQQALEYLRQAQTASGSAAREAAIRAEWSARMACV